MSGVIFVNVDTLRADHVGCYGNKARTPALDRFAEDAAVFESNFAASYPTVPNRLDIWTGQYSFLERGWTSLVPDDVTLPDILADRSIVSNIVFDTPFLGRYNFNQGFDGWQRVRGHHGDQLSTDPTVDTTFPAESHKLKQHSNTRQYLRNSARWDYERDYIAPRTFSQAIEWLEKNHRHEEFCLFVDAWDPHEVFDAPQHYIDMYDDTGGDVDEIIYPVYGRPDYMSAEERDHVNARYKANVTMVDRWVGELIETVDRLGLSDDVLFIFTSDHGHLFGEHELQGKPTGSLGKLYMESIRTPLLVRHPEGAGAGERIQGITQPTDIMPTVLDFLDVIVPETVQGESILPLLTGDRESIRDYALTARYPEGPEGEAEAFDGWAGPTNSISPVTITDRQWSLIIHPDEDQSELYDWQADPSQEEDLINEYPDRAREMRSAYIEFVQGHDADQQMVEPFTTGSYDADAIPADQPLYMFQNDDGRQYAHTSRDLADQRCPEQYDDIEQTTFGSLREKNAKSLVYIKQQYYWAEDLA